MARGVLASPSPRYIPVTRNDSLPLVSRVISVYIITMNKTYEVYGEWVTGDLDNGGFIDGMGVTCDTIEGSMEYVREMVGIVRDGGYTWLIRPEINDVRVDLEDLYK